MSGENKRSVILHGGRGGLGNQHFATSTMQAPKYAQPGQEAIEIEVQLELKVIADVGLVGFPNVGKSTFLSRVTNAQPKIANYHFTTLQPNLGVVEAATMGAGYTKYIIFAMIDGLQKIITGAAPADVSGPIGVAKMAGEMANQGMLPLLNFIAFLSINLGVINLLPLPALDGGHFVLLVLEAVRGKPLGARATNAIQMVGVAIILSITVLAVFNDISR